MKKLKVCLISLTIAPDRIGGATRYFTELYNYLKKQGHDVKYITGKWNIQIDNPDVIQIEFLRKRYIWAPNFYYNVLKFIRNKDFDIVHGNGPKGTFPITFSGHKRFISTIYDLGPFETEFTLLPLEKNLIKFISKKATYITTISNTTILKMKYYMPNINTNKIYNISCAVNDKFRPNPKDAQKIKEKLGLKGPILLYIGRIAFYKGLDDIIRAYKIVKKKIKNLELVIGGIPDYKMIKYYNSWKKTFKDIHFVGSIPEEMISAYYSMGDIFITYSFASEGFGLTPIEAIACGTPVICSSISAFKEVLEDNAIFVPPKNPQKLAEEIELFLKNVDIRKDIIEKAQKFIQKYRWDVVGKNLERVYKVFLSH
jgi:glycosyltransferase involved in cell wall biosynthesis